MTAMVHSPARALDVGSVIAGTYTIEGLIGKGGMGAVFMASHARLPGKKVAIKVLHPDVADGESLARFKREAEIASRLGHPNIVQVHDWNQLPDGTPYIVYELLEGESLSDRLRRGPMGYDEAMAILRQVGSALAAAHREGIVHRDLKPQNIFLVQADDGVSVKAKVLDFGISKIRGSTTVKTQDTAMLGTPQYMAPEQATGQHSNVDGRTDVFALGAVVYEMFAGVPAFQGTTIPEVVFKVVYEETPSLAEKVPGVPPHVASGVHRALSKKPVDRWDDVSTFVEALTGSPLTSGKRNLVPGLSGDGGGGGTAAGMGSVGNTPKTGQDAFAATVGSGDHASAMAASMRASMAAAATVAGTAQSGNGPSPVSPPVVVTTPPIVTESPGGKSKTLVIVTITVMTIAAAIVAVVVVGGGKKSEDAGGQIALEGSGTDTTPVGKGRDTAGGDGPSGTGGSGAGTSGGGTSGGGSGSQIDHAGIGGGIGGSGRGAGGDTGSGGGIGSGTGTMVGFGDIQDASTDRALAMVDAGVAPTVDAGVNKPKVDAGSGGATGDPPDDEETGQDPELRQMLGDAHALLLAGDDEGALRLAKKITNKFPKAQAAWAVRAGANCGLQDQEAARSDFRRISKPALARATRRACKSKGIDL